MAEHHPYDAGQHEHHPEDQGQQLDTHQGAPVLLDDLQLARQAWGPAVGHFGVHLLHPEAHRGQDDEASFPAGLQGEHHPLGDGGQAGRHPHGHAEGHGRQLG